MSARHTASQAVAAKIIKALDSITYEPNLVASALTRAPAAIQRKLWLIVKMLIRLWAIDAKHRTYEPINKDIHDWAERIDNGND